jgi:hypothetical protein
MIVFISAEFLRTSGQDKAPETESSFVTNGQGLRGKKHKKFQVELKQNQCQKKNFNLQNSRASLVRPKSSDPDYLSASY